MAYQITHRKMNDDDSRIIAVKIQKGGVEDRKSRTEVVADIGGGETVTTALGASVHVVTVDGEKFIRTDRNATKKDNLGSLPTF